MLRTLIPCAVLLAAPLVDAAADPPAPTETVIHLRLTPAAAPRPALRYQLLPTLGEMNPGNPVLGYLRCFSEQNNFFFNKEAVDKREKWLDMPLKDLPLKELRNYGGIALRQADYAARLDTPDWQMLAKLKKEGAALLLPDVQQLRTLASALKVRFRAQIAAGRLDAALVSAKTMLALARHLGMHPALISNLVGIAIASLALDPLDEMLQQPGCPNLYWALTNLPHPLIDPRTGVQGERLMMATEAAILDERAPMTEAQLRKAMERLYLRFVNLLIGDVVQAEKVFQGWLQGRIEDKAYVRAARRRLVEYGLAKELVQRFPPLQVVLLDLKRAFEIEHDEILKTMALPYWQAQAQWDAHRLHKEFQAKLFEKLLWILPKVRLAQARVEQRLGLLHCVEALRIYAAAHDGKLPVRLADVELPLPVDPVTGKSFIYALNGATAILKGTPPRDMEKIAAYNVRYEVTIRK